MAVLKTPQQVAAEVAAGNAKAVAAGSKPANDGTNGSYAAVSTPKPVATPTVMPANNGTNGSYASISTPKPIGSTSSTIIAAPQPVYNFGASASQKAATDPTYFNTRNDSIAKEYGTKGYNSIEAINKQLLTNQEFASSSEADRNHTAQDIYSRIQKTQPVQDSTIPTIGTSSDTNTPVVANNSGYGKFADGTEWSSTDWDSAIANASDPALKQDLTRLKADQAKTSQNFLSDVNYEYGKGLQAIDDLKTNYDITTREHNRAIDEAKINTQRQGEDVRKLVGRTIAAAEMGAALSGTNRSSGFEQGIKNIQDDANTNLDRLAVDNNNYNAKVADAKSDTLKQFNNNTARAKEALDYQFRDLLNNTSLDVATIVKKYPDLSSDKLTEELAKIGESFTLKGQDAVGKYIDTSIKINKETRDNIDQIMQMQDFSNKIEDRTTDTWMANNGMGLLTLTTNDIAAAVKDGRIKPDTGTNMLNLTKSKAVATLSALGVPTAEDIKFITDAIDNGTMNAQIAVNTITANNPDRYKLKTTSDRAKLDDNTLYNQATGETRPIRSSASSNSSVYSGPTIPPVSQQNVQTAIQTIQVIPDGSTGGQCGSFVNNYLESAGVGRLFQDPITQKAGISNSQTPTVGSIAIMDSPTAPEYGHVGIVTKVNADGSYEMKDSNRAGPEKVGSRKMQAGSATYGFYDPTLGKKQGSIAEDSMDSYINTFNDSKFNPNKDIKTEEDKAVYKEFLAKQNSVMRDKNASMEDILKYSAGYPGVTDGQYKPLEKFQTVLSQLGDVSKQVSEMKTGPIIGNLQKLNPWSTPVATLKTQLTALVPGLARGVYGEVGVLTDNDIRLYSQTIPSLTNTEDQNKAIMSMTLKVLANGYKTQLQSLAAAKRDVSGYQGLYDQFNDAANQLMDEVKGNVKTNGGTNAGTGSTAPLIKGSTPGGVNTALGLME